MTDLTASADRTRVNRRVSRLDPPADAGLVGSGPDSEDGSCVSVIATDALLGVLGGMGPLATVSFYRTLVELTPASCDQEHLRTLIWSDPTIPDRSSALLGDGISPLRQLRAGVALLESAGANMIAIPCNTAHAFVPALRQETSVPIIDMVRATVADCAAQLPSGGVIGVLATRGTQQGKLYDLAARELGVRVRYPTEREQGLLVDRAIAMVKGGQDLPGAGALVSESTHRLMDAGAGVVVGACTEIPVAAEAATERVPLVDSLRCLAMACLAAVGTLSMADVA